MKLGDKLKDQQGRTYTVTDLAHWSTIVADHDAILTYSVKWYGSSAEGLLFVGFGGPTFVLVKS